MPFSLQNLTSFGDGLLGWSSIWLTAGTVLTSGFLSRISRFLMPKLLTPMFLTLPVPCSFCISIQVFSKFQSLRCLDLSSGSVELGQCYVVVRLDVLNFWNDTYHQVQVNVVHVETLQTAVDAVCNAVVPCVVELRCNPDLFTWNARVLDALTNLVLITVSKSSVDVAVSSKKSVLDSVADLIGL